MKTIFTLTLLAITCTALAHPDDGKLSVTNLSSQRILVEVDGKKMNNRANNYENLVLIPALSTGYHSLKVYAMVDNRNDNRYGIRKQILLYQKTLNVKPQYHIDIVINRFWQGLAR